MYSFHLQEIEKGTVGEASTSTLLGIIGVTNIIGRVVFGYISDKPCVNRLYLYNVTLTFAGIGKEDKRCSIIDVLLAEIKIY